MFGPLLLCPTSDHLIPTFQFSLKFTKDNMRGRPLPRAVCKHPCIKICAEDPLYLGMFLDNLKQIFGTMFMMKYKLVEV